MDITMHGSENVKFTRYHSGFKLDLGGGGGIENVFNNLFQQHLADLNRDIYYEIIHKTIP
jgi:hypothetical protein